MNMTQLSAMNKLKTTRIITVFHAREDLERFKRGIPPRKNPYHGHLKDAYALASKELNLSRYLYFGIESYTYTPNDLPYCGIRINDNENTHYAILDVYESKASISDYYNWSDIIFFMETKEPDEILTSLRLLKDDSLLPKYRSEKHRVIQAIYDRSCIANIVEYGVIRNSEEYLYKIGGLKNGMEYM